jgi:hypothetical protein
VTLFYNEQAIVRCYNLFRLFEKDRINENFHNMDKIGLNFNYIKANHPDYIRKYNLPERQYSLPSHFIYEGKEYDMESWLTSQMTTGLVILKIEDIKNATLLYEKYWMGADRYDKRISWSTGKSIVGALIGIAIDEGFIKSIYQNVTEYIPDLKGTAYDGVIIKDVLQMSSGVEFNEDYFNTFSDINKFMAYVALDFDPIDFIKTLKRINVSGTVNNYISIDTQILGMILNASINVSLTEYLENKLWKKGGFECDLFWLKSYPSNIELAIGTINTCTRDYAKFGWLFMNMGKSPYDGSQLISEKWINDSITITDKHLMPGINKNYPMGYGYQIWIPDYEGDYLAIGIYNQFIYISPKHKIVIAKNSANYNYNLIGEISELEAVAAFRQISKYLSELS